MTQRRNTLVQPNISEHLEKSGYETDSPDYPRLLGRHRYSVAYNQTYARHEEQLSGVHVELQPVHDREAHRYSAKGAVVGHLDVFIQQRNLADNLV